METIIATVEYAGDLRTQGVHLKSGNAFTTDAPTDNQGKGEAFSPTDLVSAALSSCMMSIMGQVANREGVDMKGLKTEVVKIMAANPRKIASIKLTFSHPDFKTTNIQKHTF